MAPGSSSRAGGAGGAPPWLVAADLVAKALLLVAVARVAVDPTWGNLEGKAPGTRAVAYPLLALTVPLLHLWRPRGRYPWLADLLLTAPAFSDILGNRLDLYDGVSWFDDFIHFANTAALSAGVVLLAGAAHEPLLRRLELAVAWGLTFSLTWEVWEYVAFVTRSNEIGTAYADTVWDLGLGWCGAVLAAVLIGVVGSRHEPAASPALVEADRPVASRDGGGAPWG